jgi:hypothetical protein
MARIAPSQPNEAMARIASRRNFIISLERVQTDEYQGLVFFAVARDQAPPPPPPPTFRIMRSA